MAECSDNTVSNSANFQNQGCATIPTDLIEDSKTEKAMESNALLIEEIREDSLPKSLDNLMKSMRKDGRIVDRNDMVMGILYIFMLEAGFVPKIHSETIVEKTVDFHFKRLLKLTTSMPKDWKMNSTLYKMDFILAPFPLYSCTLLCSLNSGDLVMNCFVRNIPEASRSMLIDATQYVVISSMNLNIRYQNLDSLSRKFKNTVANPMRNYILHENNHDGYTIEDLPAELVLEIARYLDLNSLLRFSGSCKRFYTVCKVGGIVEKVIKKMMDQVRNKTRLIRLANLRAGPN